MSAQKPLELYLGKRIEDLDNMYPVPDLRGKKPKMLCASAQKIFAKAEKTHDEGNEELAYVHYMKYLRVVTVLSKDPEYIKDKKFYNSILGVSNPDKAITIAERLKIVLTERYKENDRNRKTQDIEDQQIIKQKFEEDRKKAADMKKTTHFTKTVINKGMPGSDDVTITSKQLYTLLKERNHKIMILDIRPAKDFCESHIAHRYCVSVPEDIISAGQSANVLEQNLPMESKKVWTDRESMDLIVLLDWTSTAMIPGKPLHVLRTILLKWDIKVHYKRSPVALERGYEDFVLRYPSLSTNPHISTPSANTFLDDVLGDIDYPNSIDDFSTNEEMSPSIDRQTSYISTSRPMYVPGNPSVDRSSKAAAIQTYSERARSMQHILDKQEKLLDSSLDVEMQRINAEKDWENVRSKTEKEGRSSEEQSDHQLREQEIISLLMQLENKQHDMELENQYLRNKLDVYRQKEMEEAERTAGERGDTINSSGDTPTPIEEGVSVLDEKNSIVRRHLEEKEERILAVERQRDELERTREAMESERKRRLAQARNNKKPTQAEDEDYDGYIALHDDDSPGMNRSHSSPNIVQMGDEEISIPQFDRTTKPHKVVISSELNQTRQRDFQPVFGRVGRGLTGLKNLGNTCYMNSIIQCLNNTYVLAAYLCSGEYRDHVNRGHATRGIIADELAAVLRALCSGQYRFIAIKDLRSVVGKHQTLFRGVEQQDSHEFLTILMDWLHDDLQFPIKQQERDGLAASERAWQEYTKCRESVVLRLFHGQMRSTVRCCVCSEESVTYDSFSNLSLELPPNANRCSLGDCLRLYLNGEKIIGWNCPSCKDKRDATKKLDISRLPPVLVIHFKRFYVDPTDYMSNTYRKKQTYIDFPLENLDMRHLSLQSLHLAQRSSVYNLYGVSNHYGSMEGGHYTAYCKSSNYGKWYKFDDHVVSEISPSDVKSSAAYILFYTTQVAVP